MTKQELNRDITRLYKYVNKLMNNPSDEYYQAEPEIKKEIQRLYYADKSLNSLTKKSILILLRLNIRFRAIPLHSFGLHIEY